MLQHKSVTPSSDVYSFGILMWQLKENEIPYASIKCNDVIIYQVVKKKLRPDSTMLLLSELNEKISLKEKRNFKYCKSDLLDALQVSPKLNTPVKSFSANRKPSRTEVRKNRDIKQEGRDDKKYSRKNLFMEKFKVVEDEDELSSPKCFQNLFVQHDLQLRAHEKLFHMENRYNQLYKASWNEDPMMRPSTEEILTLLQEFLGRFEKEQ